jgi:hypothetical protein
MTMPHIRDGGTPDRAVSPQRIFLIGAIGLVAFVALGAVTVWVVDPMPWIAAPFLLSVPFAVVMGRLNGFAAFPALLIAAALVGASGLTVSVPLFGAVAPLGAGAPIPADIGTAGYAASGWTIDTTHTTTTPWTSRRETIGVRVFAPLVAPGWTPRDAVDVWVEAYQPKSGKIGAWHPQFWRQEGGEFIRLVGADLSSSTIDAKQAATKLGLQTVAAPMIVMRTDSVRAAMVDQFLTHAGIAAGAVGLWGLVVLAIGWRMRRKARV